MPKWSMDNLPTEDEIRSILSGLTAEELRAFASRMAEIRINDAEEQIEMLKPFLDNPKTADLAKHYTNEAATRIEEARSLIPA